MPIYITREPRPCDYCEGVFEAWRSNTVGRVFCSRSCYRNARNVIPTDVPGSPTDLAWAAGLLDGEGYIGVTWRKTVNSHTPWWYIQVVLTNTHQGALERFVAVLGRGRYYAKKPVEGRQPVFYVAATGVVATTILHALLPYLVIKREQALLALEAREIGMRVDQAVSEECWLRMIEIENAIKALNGINPAKRLATPENRPMQREKRQTVSDADRQERIRTQKRNSTAVKRAVAKGRLARPRRGDACEDCGETDRKLRAAHPDPTSPLNVRWLCRACGSRHHHF